MFMLERFPPLIVGQICRWRFV